MRPRARIGPRAKTAYMTTDILVLGAGMVGVSTALALRQRGHRVLLVDRKSPGRETSYGNAGMIPVSYTHLTLPTKA